MPALQEQYGLGRYRLSRLERMIGVMARGGGSIVNVSSVASSIKGAGNRFAYGTSKPAVIGLTKAIAADYVQRKIRCNAICPATVRTPSLEARVAALPGNPEENWQSFLDRQPMRCLGTPQEIGALASDESSFTTGSAYVIDGGWERVGRGGPWLCQLESLFRQHLR